MKCIRCGLPHHRNSQFCAQCFELLSFCSYAITKFVLTNLVVKVADNAWYFNKGAKEVADFLWEAFYKHVQPDEKAGQPIGGRTHE